MSEELEAWKNQNLAAEDSPPAREIEASLKEIRDAAVVRDGCERPYTDVVIGFVVGNHHN